MRIRRLRLIHKKNKLYLLLLGTVSRKMNRSRITATGDTAFLHIHVQFHINN